jgi:hypothetical protein
MKSISKASMAQRVRQLGVAIAITGATAAVAAAVVLAERPESDQRLTPTASAELVSGGATSWSDRVERTRSPKDAGRATAAPWVKRSRLDVQAEQAEGRADTPADVSLPPAAEALKDRAAETTVAAPTF